MNVRPKGHTFFFLLLLCSALFLPSEVVHAQSVEIIPITIKEGLSSYHGKGDDPFSSVYAQKQQAFAAKVGINLENYFNEKYIYVAANGGAYFLFFNLASAPACKREFLIQKVKLTKAYYNNDELVFKKEQYLVEVFKLNQFKKTKRADQHYKSYDLEAYDKRSLELDIEIGCGEIPGHIEGFTWPFEQKTLYNRYQDYIADPGVYDSTVFTFSTIYKVTFSFDRENHTEMSLPDFLN